MRYLIIIPGMLFLMACAGAANHTCTQQEAIQAETQTLKNWNDVYETFENFSHCDDGSIGEHFSDSIAHLLAEDWTHIEKLNNLIKSHADFLDFVVRHIDGLMSLEQRKTITKNSQHNCPIYTEELCKNILYRLKEVDANMKSN